METPSNVAIEVHLEDSGAPSSMGAEIREGLSRSPRRINSKYFYDAQGSRLFERITELPEYYLTRAEESLLRHRAGEIARRTDFEEFVELGSGAATKTRLLIEAGLAHGSLRRYIPVEVSEDIAVRAAMEIGRGFPEVDVHALVGDFESHLGKVPNAGCRLFAFLGSTIGNFPGAGAVDFLKKIAREMDRSDWLLLGTDLVKDRAILEAAYNDSEGVTAEFTRNILRVVNRHLDSDFDPSRFEHVAFYNEEHARMEAHLRSTRDQRVRFDAIDFEVDFASGEMLWVEVSCKYTRASVAEMLTGAGLELLHWFEGDDAAFALSLARLS